MKLLIYPNPNYMEKVRYTTEHLIANGFVCAVSDANLACFEGLDVCIATEISDCDYIAAIGGDGTILHAASTAIEHSVPLFGINAGRVGYLAAFDVEESHEITPNRLAALQASERTLLEAEIVGKGRVNSLNDVVIFKENHSKSVELSVRYGEDDIAIWKADGVIVSTATGSTAYSLSAGGPLVSPDLDVMLVTPICPANGFNRSLVLGGEKPIRFRPTERNENGIVLAIDGVDYGSISGDIVIKRADKTLILLASASRSFYTKYYSHNFERP